MGGKGEALSMSKRTAIGFVTMMFLLFACLATGALARGYADRWVEPASPAVRAQLLPLLQRAEKIDAAPGLPDSLKKATALQDESRRLTDASGSLPDKDQRAIAAMDHYTVAMVFLAMEARASVTRPTPDTDRLSARKKAEESVRLPQPADSLRSLWAHSADPLMGLAFLVFLPLVFLVPFAPTVRSMLRNRHVRRVGVHTYGVVIDVESQGMVNYVPYYKLTLRLPEGDTTVAYGASYTSFESGMEIPLLVDPTHRGHAVIDGD